MPQADVSALSVIDLAKELKRYNIVDTSVLTRLHHQLPHYIHQLENGEDISSLAELRYPESWLLQLWDYADQSTSVPDIGIKIGSTITREAHGLLAHWMLHSDTLEMALLTYLNNVSLVNASEQWKMETNNGNVELTLTFPVEKHYPRCAIERSLISIPCMGEYLCGRKIPLKSVAFTFPKPTYQSSIKKQLGCSLSFSEKANKLVFDVEILQWPLPNKSPYIRRIIEHRSKKLDIQTQDDSLSYKIRNLWQNGIEPYSELGEVARKLHMSRSTLYRKLKTENTSFSKLLDSERQKMIQGQPHLPAHKACELLGFNDISAYYKACKRWKDNQTAV